jgi:hypothetical protein
VSPAFGKVTRRIKTRERAEEAFGLPVMAEIPKAAPAGLEASPEVEVLSRPESATTEAYRRLAAHTEDVLGQEQTPRPVHSARPPQSGWSILVSSPREEPARSFVAVNLAALFADSGHRVLVVTTRGLRGGPAPDPGTPADPGPVDPTTAHGVVARARPSWIPGVSSLALGQMFSTSDDLIRDFDAFVGAAGEVVDLVVFEAPLLTQSIGTALLSAVDLGLVVCECGRTGTEDGFECQRLLTLDAFLPVLGLVWANAPA